MEDMEYLQFSAKSVEDAITEACAQLMVTSDELEYEVVNEGSSGFLGIAVKPAVIRARKKGAGPVIKADEAEHEDMPAKEAPRRERPARAPREEKAPEAEEPAGEPSDVDGDAVIARAKSFLNDVFAAMQLPVNMTATYNNVGDILSIDLEGDDMGVLIGKRGQTLDSLQYLVSLVVNRNEEAYIHVKLDTEDYRERRKETLEILARNIAYKVRKSRSSIPGTHESV